MGNGPLPAIESGEKIEVQFIPVNDESFLRNRNNVAFLSNKRLVYIKKKVLGEYWELVDISRDKVRSVSLGSKFALGGMILGAGAILIALVVLYYGVVAKQMSGIGVLTIPPIFGIPGIIAVLGAIRKTVDFDTEEGLFRFVSPPLKGKIALKLLSKSKRALK